MDTKYNIEEHEDYLLGRLLSHTIFPGFQGKTPYNHLEINHKKKSLQISNHKKMSLFLNPGFESSC